MYIEFFLVNSRHNHCLNVNGSIVQPHFPQAKNRCFLAELNAITLTAFFPLLSEITEAGEVLVNNNMKVFHPMSSARNLESSVSDNQGYIYFQVSDLLFSTMIRSKKLLMLSLSAYVFPFWLANNDVHITIQRLCGCGFPVEGPQSSLTYHTVYRWESWDKFSILFWRQNYVYTVVLHFLYKKVKKILTELLQRSGLRILRMAGAAHCFALWNCMQAFKLISCTHQKNSLIWNWCSKIQ